METIRDRSDERPWWIDRIGCCNSCGSTFKLTASDEVAITQDPLNHANFYASLHCPACANGLIIVREVDLLAGVGTIQHLKRVLALIVRQRDRLLKMTRLDTPGDPNESTEYWEEHFNKEWVRRSEIENAAPEAKQGE